MQKMHRCPECGHACIGYDYDTYMNQADFFATWANKFTKGLKLENEKYDEYYREDILNLAEDGPEQDWLLLQQQVKQGFLKMSQSQSALTTEEKEIIEQAKENPFVNIPNNLVIFGRRNK